MTHLRRRTDHLRMKHPDTLQADRAFIDLVRARPDVQQWLAAYDEAEQQVEIALARVLDAVRERA